MTSKSYADARAVRLSDADFDRGGLRLVSYARPTKPFTAHESLFVSEVESLSADSIARITGAVVALFQQQA